MLSNCNVLLRRYGEVDCLLDGGFELNIRTIVAQLPSARQTLAFSATVPKKLMNTLSVALKPDHVVVDCVGQATVGWALSLFTT